MIWIRWAAVAVIAFAMVTVHSAPAMESQSCVYLWENYKIDRTLWPDDHGHSGGEIPDGSWQYENSKWGEDTYNTHWFFEEGVYAELAHDMCAPDH